MSICDVAVQFATESRPRVLFIEDDASIVMLTQRIFAGFEVDLTIAQDYFQAMVELEQREWNLILLDLKIPGCSTPDLLRLVGGHTRCPVMVCSGMIDEKAIHSAIALLDRPIWFLEKPVQFNRERIQQMFQMVNLPLQAKSLRG